MHQQPSSDPRQPGPRQRAGVPALARLRGMRIIAVMVVGILALASGSAAVAETYPASPVRLIVSTGAGGAPDVIARIVAEGLSRRWGQQMFVANHPGAAGSIGMKVAGTSPPHGHTLLFGRSSSFVALPAIAQGYPYDLVR